MIRLGGNDSHWSTQDRVLGVFRIFKGVYLIVPYFAALLIRNYMHQATHEFTVATNSSALQVAIGKDRRAPRQ